MNKELIEALEILEKEKNISHYVRSNRKLPSDRMQESFW